MAKGGSAKGLPRQRKTLHTSPSDGQLDRSLTGAPRANIKKNYCAHYWPVAIASLFYSRPLRAPQWSGRNRTKTGGLPACLGKGQAPTAPTRPLRTPPPPVERRRKNYKSENFSAHYWPVAIPSLFFSGLLRAPDRSASSRTDTGRLPGCQAVHSAPRTPDRASQNRPKLTQVQKLLSSLLT